MKIEKKGEQDVRGQLLPAPFSAVVLRGFMPRLPFPHRPPLAAVPPL
jgi:hypothetical protein